MKTDQQYIREHYIELNELAEKTGFSAIEILELIDKKVIPNYSYSIQTTETISSPLLDESVTVKDEKYFAKSHVQKLEQYKRSDGTPEIIKDIFKQNFISHLQQHPDKMLAYNNLFDSDAGIDDQLLNETFEKEWQHYCNGVYGICTINADEKDIVEKEIAVKKIVAFNKQYENRLLNETAKEELIKLNEAFNKVTALFAPYQRKTSSRGKYVDKILEENHLNDWIKNYD